jgi:ribosomal protein S18 acetylase RimI-like enzyme
LVTIGKLPADRWREYRDLRLEALRREPTAYGSSTEETNRLTEKEWRRRIKSVLFALSDDKPVGMIVYVFNQRLKSRHIAEIYGFCLNADYRGEGLGTRLLERALSLIQKNKRIVKVQLAVNPEQRYAVEIYRKAGFVVTGRAEKELKVGRARDFERQVKSKFGGAFTTAWKEAVSYVKRFDKETLLSADGFFKEVYRPKRDDLAEKWTEASQGSA